MRLKMESWTTDVWEKNGSTCLEELQEEVNWLQIPLMNTSPSHLLKEGQLVRFRGMIQDMLNPVYYMSKYEVHNTVTNEKTVRSGKYRDSLLCADHETVLFDSELSEHQERRPVYCITVPAVNQWAQHTKCEIKPNENNTGEQHSSPGVKRSVETDEISGERTSSSGESSKRLRSSDSAMETESSEPSSKPVNLNLPIPNKLAEACLINLYDLEKAAALKMNDVIEAAGFLSYDPATVTSCIDGMAEDLPPPSLVPRLHAVTWRTVDFGSPLPPSCGNSLADASKLRDELKLVLTQLLFGDLLAADYLICHLISRVYLRQDLLVLGKFSLNLSNIPSTPADYTSQLYQFLQTLLDKSHFLPMTLENMNTTVMIPKKNYETNRLESGMLQLSRKTHLVLDETRLEPGQLNDRGVRNCRALSSVIANQRLEYDFQFYPVEFHTDIPVLVLSEGKSLLPSDFQVTMQADPSCLSTVNEVFAAAYHYLQEPLLSQLRVYLSTVSDAPYDLSHEVQQIVQEDFVKMRQENQKTSAQDLHTLLVLARYLSLSEGCHSLSKECWARALQMERERKYRLSNLNRRYLRQDLLVLGKFSLNLSNIPSTPADYTSQLYQFLQTLLDKSHFLPMTLENMNTTVMIPKKNYETNRLESGMLQLSRKTHLVLDETRLEPGQLNDRGVRNCRALSSVIANQRLEYDFQFYPVEFHTDIPVLVLSEGKSMLPSDFQVAMQADPSCLSTVNEVFAAAYHYLQEPLLSQLRVYLSTVSDAPYDLSNEVQQIVQEDFVKMRQENQKTSAQDLHTLLVLARYLSLSEGCHSLTKECWARALQMERERKDRLSNLNRR